MATPYFSIVTDLGTRKMMQAVAEGRKVNITHLAAGDGNGRYVTPTAQQLNLKNEVWRGEINTCYISEESENILIVTAVVPSTVGGFTIREMGVFDEAGDLIAVCNTPDTQKVRVVDGVAHELDLQMEILLSNTDSVELVIDPNVVTATKKDLEILRIKHNADMENVNAMVQEQLQEALKIIQGADSTIAGLQSSIVKMAMILATITDADFLGADNIVVETFKDNADDIIFANGGFDSSNKRLYA